MDGEWVESAPQWWWKYVFPGVRDRFEEPSRRFGPFPQPWRSPWRSGPIPVPWRSAGPVPDPWRVVLSELLSEVSFRGVAERMPEGEEQNRLRERYGHRVSEIIDDFCGTSWRRPIPIPGPRPWVLPAVEQLAAAAHSLQEGSMREEVLRVAGELMQKALSEERR
jgi:hypothetical protein